MSSVLDDLKNLTLISKRLSESHVKSLTNFCFIAFDNLSKVEIEYSIDPDLDQPTKNGYSSTENGYRSKKNGFIRYKLYRKNKKKSLGSRELSVAKRVMSVRKWTISIFWDDLEVVFLNEKGEVIGE